MTSGAGGTAGGRVRDALDICLSRLRRGEDLDSCVVEFPQLADELRPLLEMAQQIATSSVPPPPPPHGLRHARERFLAAAEVLAQANAEAATEGTAAIDEGRDTHLDHVLDTCLARLHGGESLAEILADHADLATHLRPLLTTAEQMLATRVTPPPPPQGLARGRERFLAVADQAQVKARAPESQTGRARVADALDACLSRLRGGENAADVVAEFPELTAELKPLLDSAEFMLAERVTPPPPPHGLSRTRERFLSTAKARSRAQRPVAAPTSPLVRLAEWFTPLQPLRVPRLVGATIAVVLFLVLTTPVLAPRVEAAIPGDPLYSVKLVAEQVRLASAFDPAQRESLEAEFSQRRAAEIERATDRGLEEEVKWSVRLLRFEHDAAVDPPQRHLVVLTLSKKGEEPKEFVLVWDESTEWSLGDEYDDIGQVPAHSRLEVRVVTRPGREPLVTYVRLVEPATPVEPVETTMPGATETAEPQEPTSAPTGTPLPPTATPTEVPPTPTIEPSVTPTPVGATPAAEPAGPRPVKKATPDLELQGAVKGRPDENTWHVAPRGQDERLVEVDVSALREKEAQGGAEFPAKVDEVKVDDWVVLVGHWTDADQLYFRAEDFLDYVPEEDRCVRASSTGFVRDYQKGVSLELDIGEWFSLTDVLDSAVNEQRGPLAIGAEVTVRWKDCGDGKRRVELVTVLRPADKRSTPTGTVPPTGPYQGIVTGIISESIFNLRADNGQDFEVHYEPGVTPITGEATEIELWQQVGIMGWPQAGTIIASAIEVYGYEPTPSPTTPPSSPTPSARGKGPPSTPPGVPTIVPSPGSTE